MKDLHDCVHECFKLNLNLQASLLDKDTTISIGGLCTVTTVDHMLYNLCKQISTNYTLLINKFIDVCPNIVLLKCKYSKYLDKSSTVNVTDELICKLEEYVNILKYLADKY